MLIVRMQHIIAELNHLFVPRLASRMAETRTFIIACLGLIGLYLFYCLVYGLFFSPTRQIPGPLLARFSNLYFTKLLFKGALSPDVHKLHQKYGFTSLTVQH